MKQKESVGEIETTESNARRKWNGKASKIQYSGGRVKREKKRKTNFPFAFTLPFATNSD
jgi:hypothetical protein